MKIGPFDVWPGPEGFIAVEDEDPYQLSVEQMFQLGAAITQQAEAIRDRLDSESEEEAT